ncbi:right-handed parallel beta-helix repeat-containing protein [Gryllotalpicola koreensis]|uniref:Right handed beta helix domain-containing protein n=1 Tax=Gryllotalpicola koreensis TaxID=993086 RepID=A0ABP7ZUI4_9MICO
MTARMTRGRRLAAAVAIAVAVALGASGCSSGLFGTLQKAGHEAESHAKPLTAGSPLKDSHAAPNGTGRDCTKAKPCELATAVARAAPGTTIRLAGGTYPTTRLAADGAPHLDGADSNAFVKPEPGAHPVFGAITDAAPHLTWTGVTVTVQWYLNGGAVGTVLDDITVDGGGLFVRSSDITVKNSEFKNGSSIDGIQVGLANNVLIEGNSVHDYNQDKNDNLHADCIQVFDSSNVTIRGNRLKNCYNTGLIISVGAGKGIHHLTVESNFIQGCIVVTPHCGGGSSAALQEKSATDLVVRNNTFANGAVRLEPTPGLVFDRNIVAYISTCDAPMTNSIVASWNTKMCGTPAVVTRDGNRAGKVGFHNQATGDLRPTDASGIRISPQGSLGPVPKDLFGRALPADVAGAAAP